MRVLFYGNRKGNNLDKVIRWWTSSFKDKINGAWKDSFSHVELEFSDGVCFSASPREGICRFKVINTNDKPWVAIDTPVPPALENKLRLECGRLEGIPYDYIGILGFIFRTPDQESKLFCSEVVTDRFQSIGVIANTINSGKVSPNSLYKILNSKVYNDFVS